MLAKAQCTAWQVFLVSEKHSTVDSSPQQIPEIVITHDDYSAKIQNITDIVQYLIFSTVIHCVDYDLVHLLRGGVCCSVAPGGHSFVAIVPCPALVHAATLLECGCVLERCSFTQVAVLI